MAIFSSGTASATAIRPEGFPKCEYCFKDQRRCDRKRRCGACLRYRKNCKNVLQQTLDAHPKRARKVLRRYELELHNSTATNGEKRAAATAAPNGGPSANKKSRVASGTSSSSGQQISETKQAELMHCSRVINELLSDKYADYTAHFLEPVNHVEWILPSLLSIFKFPMHLSAMRDDLDDGKYSSAGEFRKDFLRVVDIARWFNEKGSEVYKAADKLEELFDAVWKETK